MEEITHEGTQKKAILKRERIKEVKKLLMKEDDIDVLIHVRSRTNRICRHWPRRGIMLKLERWQEETNRSLMTKDEDDDNDDESS